MEWVVPPLPARLALGKQPFVGRRAPLQVIESAWAGVEAGNRQAIFVGGEPGAGKTRLIAETAAALYDNEVPVLLGTCRSDYGVAYQPFAEILDSLFENAAPGSMSGLIPESAGDLGLLSTAVSDHRDHAEISDRGADRRDLFDAFVDLIRALTAVKPIALMLEDLHWAQEPTRQLLRHLVESTAEQRLMLMGTYRTTAPDRDQDLTRLVADLYRLPGVGRIDLAGLDVEAITQLVAAAANQAGPDAQRVAFLLRDQTGGNPFFIEELMAHGYDRERPPATVVDALESRMRLLDESTKRAVKLAAIIGDEFSAETLIFAENDSDSVLQGLDEATRAGLITGFGDEGQYRFRHALTRQAVLEGLSSSERIEAHTQVAKALEKSSSGRGVRHADLAYHYWEARLGGGAERAIEESVAAGGQAEKSLAYEEAALWFRRAAHLDEAARERYLLAAANNLVMATTFEMARELFDEVIESEDPVLAAHAAMGWEETSWYEGRHGHEAASRLSSVLDRMDHDPADQLYVSLLAKRARALAFTGDPTAQDMSVEAIRLASDLGDPELTLTTMVASINESLVPENVAKYVERLEGLLDWARGSGSKAHELQVSLILAAGSYMVGDPIGFREALSHSTRVSMVDVLPFWNTVVQITRSADYFIRGELAKARQCAVETRRISREAGRSFDEGPFGLQMFMIEREAGRLEGLRDVPATFDDPDETWVPGLIALNVELGFTDEADRLLDYYFGQPLLRRRDQGVWPVSLALLAEAVIEVNDLEKADVIRPELARYSGANLMGASMVGVFGAADRYLAQIDAMLGDADAEVHFRSALDLDARMGATLHEVETLIAFAAYLEKSSDHARSARATQYRRRARQLAENKGLARQLRKLDAATTVKSDRPAGLTPREIEVLRLICDGLSNKDIADQLYISQNTAANHVRSILMKTQAPNRTRAAIFATENGLLD